MKNQRARRLSVASAYFHIDHTIRFEKSLQPYLTPRIHPARHLAQHPTQLKHELKARLISGLIPFFGTSPHMWPDTGAEPLSETLTARHLA